MNSSHLSLIKPSGAAARLPIPTHMMRKMLAALGSLRVGHSEWAEVPARAAASRQSITRTQTYLFQAPPYLCAEMLISCPADFDFIWKGVPGESRLEITNASPQRTAIFLRVYASHFGRLVHIVGDEGTTREEISPLPLPALTLRLMTDTKLQVTAKS